jgi:Rnl2 family RNA ligase
MKFRKYSSIENISRTKTINYIVETGNSEGEWVSTLKIHGANYSLWTDGKDVKSGKRSGFIEGSSFYGDFNFDYDQNARDMHKFLQDHMPCDVLSIHGEIYGGLYDHPDVERDKSATRVQKEVQYIPFNDFIVFDMKVDNMLIDHDLCVDLCKKFGFDHVPVLARGSFYDLMKMDVKFPDPLGVMKGLPLLENNDAEGWVLKPVKPKFFGNGERIILKGKNPDFSEKTGGKRGKPPKPVYELSDEGNRLKDELMTYLNENRLRNVLSHGEIEQVTQKDFGRLLGLFCQDAFGDFCKDNGKEYEALSKKERTVIKKNMNRVGGDVIRPNFVNIIDGEF